MTLLKYLCLFLCYMIAQQRETVTYLYKSMRGLNLTMDVILPNKGSQEPYPVFFAIHGGCFVTGEKEWSFTEGDIEEILARGWAYVTPNFRLSPGALLPDMVEDLQNAYSWVRTELVKLAPINPNAIALSGHSSGGALSLIGGYEFIPRPQAIIAYYPLAPDLTLDWIYDRNATISAKMIAKADKKREVIGYSNENSRYTIAHSALEEKVLGWLLVTKDPKESPDTISAVLKEYSAIYNVDEEYPPTYLVHGSLDLKIPAEESLKMVEALKSYNISHRIDLAQDRRHGFAYISGEPSKWKPQDRAVWMKHVKPALDFVQKYLNPKTNLCEEENASFGKFFNYWEIPENCFNYRYQR